MAESTNASPAAPDEPRGTEDWLPRFLSRTGRRARRVEWAISRLTWLQQTLGLTTGRVTVLVAVGVTLVSAIRLSVVSRGSPETALAILHSGNGALVLTALASIVPWIGAVLFWISCVGMVLITKSWWIGLGGVVLVGLTVSPVTPVWAYLAALGFALFLAVVVIFDRRSSRKASRRSTEQSRPGAVETEQSRPAAVDHDDSTFDELLGHPDWVALTRLAAVVALVIMLLTSFDSDTMWLPAERIQLTDGSILTGYELGTSGTRTIVLSERDRIVRTFPDDRRVDIASTQICSLRDQGGGSLRDSVPRMLRAIPQVTWSVRKGPRYLTCPR